MQSVSATFETALQATPKKLTLVVEIYKATAVPGSSGFDPASSDYLAGFCSTPVTFRTRTYTKKLVGNSSIDRTVRKKLSSASFTLSNLSRDAWAFERDYGFEGLLAVFRLIDWDTSSALADSSVLFIGRCRRSGGFRRSAEAVTINVEQILNQTETVIPRRKFTTTDSSGRAETDPLFEGFRFTPRSGQVSFETRERRGGILGLFGFKKTVTRYLQYSSQSDAAAETSVPVALGRVQAEGIHLGYEDLGTEIHATTAFCDGEIDALNNIRSVTPQFPLSSISPPIIKLGKLGGTGNQINDYPNFVAAGIYSRTAHILTVSVGTELDQDDSAPVIVAIILGMLIPLPDGSNDFTNTDWSDNPAYLSRWILNSEDYFNLSDDWFDDDQIVETGEFCDQVLVDKANTDSQFFPNSQSAYAGITYINLYSTGFLDYRYYRSRLGLEDPSIAGDREIDYQFYGDVPYNSDDPGGTGSPNYTIANIPVNYRRRYTANVLVKQETPAIDFLFNILFASANLYLVQNANGKLAIKANRPTDTTFIYSASSVSDDEIHVFDITKFVGDLGKILIGANLLTSEVRTVDAVRYDTSVSISVAVSGNVTTSSATLTGGTTSTPRTATLTVTGAGAKTVTIDSIDIDYTSNASDTVASAAGSIAGRINANETLNKYVKAVWNEDATITLQSKVGYLELDSALENAHATKVADPSGGAPTASSGASGSLRAGTYSFAYSYATGTGETELSAIGEITILANKNIILPAITKPAGVTAIKWYCSIEPNGVRLHHLTTNDGSAFTVNSDTIPKTDDYGPPVANLTAEEVHRVAMAFSDKAETQSALTRSNVIKGTFEFIPGSQKSINQVEIKFRDASADFELTTLRINDRINQAKVGAVNKLEINGAAIDNHHQARRIGNQKLNENRDGDFFFGLVSDGEALLLEEGDVIAVTDESGEFVNEPVRIEELEFLTNNGYPTMKIIGRKYRRWFFDDQVVEKLVGLPIVQNNPINRVQTGPTINQPVSPPTADTAYQMTVEIIGGQTSILGLYRRIRVSENSDMSDYTETIIQASTLNGIISQYQIVDNPNPEATANTRYIQIALSSNGETFGENSNILTVTYAGTSSGSGSSGSTQDSSLVAIWDETNDEVDLTWTIGTPTGTQELQRKLQSDPVSSFADVSPAPGNTDTSYSQSITKTSMAVNYSYRVRLEGVAGYSNTASVTIPAAPQPPTLAGEFDAVGEEVDLTATAGTNGSGDFTFERKVTGAADGTYTSLATQASASYSDAQVPGATARSYTYRVKQATPSGEYSNTVTVEIPATNDEPTLDTVTWDSGDTEVDVTFTNNGGSNNMTVEYKLDGDVSWGSATPTIAPGAGSGSVTIIRDLTDQDYSFRLYQSDTGYSNEITGITIPGSGAGGGPS